MACFLTVAGQLALVLLAAHLLRLEPQRPFFPVLCLAAGGFAVHAWLPRRFRLPFFALLSLAAAVLLLGFAAAGWVLLLGGGLVAVCYLPVPLAFRVLLIATGGVLLALWRVESNAPFWPVLASMFMFRLIVYLFDIRHERHRPPLLLSLAYFFPLPNFCFTLFPVLDFKTFRQTYYDDEPYTIYQSGVAWIVRGLTHLVLYRLVKYYLLPAPHEVRDLPHLVLFLATNYALYLRVSGWFHLVTGVLHLFGFNLPRTHDNYFLASSLSDIWRRINIYWKDFMSKMFFHPAFFALRRWGTRPALVAAGLGVFVATWLLHSYQAFWLLGKLPLGGHDALLWLTAGVVVVANLQRDLRRVGKLPPPETGAAGVLREALAGAILSLKIAGTFLLVSLFWACWTVPRFPTYLYVRATSGAIDARGVLLVLGGVAGFVAAGAAVRVGRSRLALRELFPAANSFAVSAAAQAAVLAVLVGVGLPAVGDALDPRAGEVLATLRLESTTPVEAAFAVQGYYEEIADAPLQVSPLLGGRPEPKRAGAEFTEFSRYVDDYLDRELIPGWHGQVARHPFTVNRLGLRDREGLTREKPAGACRIAVVGSSVVMGWGVDDDQTFTHLLDDKLNAAREDRPGRVEVLNFGTGNSHALHRLVQMQRKVFAFEPDAVLYVAHQDEFLGPVRHLTKLVANRDPLPYRSLREVVRKAAVSAETPPGETEARLQPFAPELVRGLYGEMVAECRERGVLPVWVYVPMPGVVNVSIKAAELIGQAEAAGFVVLNLTGWDQRYGPEEVKIDEHHANALGHRLIAERLAAALREHPEALPECARPE